MTALAEIFDGDVHHFIPGEDFTWPCRNTVINWEELEDAEPLLAHESPSLRPIMTVEKPDWHGKDTIIKFRLLENMPEMYYMEQGWACLSVVLSQVIAVVIGEKKQYQVNHTDGTHDWTFEFRPVLGGWEGGRL